jgi:hypothetical protein
MGVPLCGMGRKSVVTPVSDNRDMRGPMWVEQGVLRRNRAGEALPTVAFRPSANNNHHAILTAGNVARIYGFGYDTGFQ